MTGIVIASMAEEATAAAASSLEGRDHEQEGQAASAKGAAFVPITLTSAIILCPLWCVRCAVVRTRTRCMHPCPLSPSDPSGNPSIHRHAQHGGSGMPFEANASNLCADCLRGQVNLSSEVQPNQPVIQCKGCHRWQAKNKHVRACVRACVCASPGAPLPIPIP